MDSDEPPPSYEEAMNEGAPPPASFGTGTGAAGASSSTAQPRGDSTSSVVPSSLPFAQDFRTHKIISVYRTASFCDYLLARSSDDPNPIAYVTTHTYTRPQLELHSTASVASPVMADAEIPTLSNILTINIPSARVSETVERESLFVDVYSLFLVHPISGRRELYQWRHSSGPQVQALNGQRRGWKLVRTATNEIITVYAGAISLRKVGKMQWLSNDSYGDIGELLVMTSLLAIVEKERRDDTGARF